MSKEIIEEYQNNILNEISKILSKVGNNYNDFKEHFEKIARLRTIQFGLVDNIILKALIGDPELPFNPRDISLEKCPLKLRMAQYNNLEPRIAEQIIKEYYKVEQVEKIKTEKLEDLIYRSLGKDDKGKLVGFTYNVLDEK